MNETGFVILKTAHGIDVPVRYGLSAIKRLCRHYECKLRELGEKINQSIEADEIETMELLVKVGAEAEAALNGQAITFNEEQLLSTLDTPGTFAKLMDAFNGAFGAFDEPTQTEEADPKVGKIRPSQKAGPTSGEK